MTAPAPEPFADIAPPLSRDAAGVEAARCLFCFDAPCIRACPTHIDVPSFIKKIATGNLRGSARTILDANPMGHSCARACPVEVLCEGACVLNARDEKPIQIALLQRHATDHALQHRLRLFEPGPATGRRVAIVGAGPAGLSAAQDLRRLGHAVVMFEQKSRPGGLNTYGIAEYKMRPETALAEAQMVLDLGVELRSNTAVGRDVPFAQLKADFDAVLIAVGLGATRRLGIPGEDLSGVVDALSFIEHLKTHPYHDTKVGRRVVVIGGGNTAIDAVTQSKRLGAESATLVYRRGEEDMSAYDYEVELARRDGCELRFHCTPKQILGTTRVTGLQCAESAEPIPCDMVILAIGQRPRDELAAAAGLVTEGNRLVSTTPGVFVAGDCGNGGKEIVNAAAEGKQAARAIHDYLKAN
jgi:glutamate synthase (NADPH/NADH) small chain